MKIIQNTILSSAMVLSMTSIAAADTYRASTWLPESEGTVIQMHWFDDALAQATDGAIDFDIFAGAALMPPKAHLGGVGDGVVQLGFHTSGYTPSDVPMANALGGFGFIASDPVTIGAAWTDFLMHDAAQNAEFTNHNVVPVGAFSTPTYPIICNTSEPITELSQMKGLKVRSIGLIANLVQSLGGVAVNIPATEIYQALQTKQIDCAGIFPAWLNIDNKLEEVSNSVTMMEWTGSYNSPLHLYNRDFWNDLSADHRRTIFELAARAQARLQISYQDNQIKALSMAEANGHKIVQPADSIQAAVKEWVDNGVGDMAGIAKNTYGIDDPDALFARFRPYVEKWQGLIGDLGDKKFDEDALTAVLIANIYDSVDAATYGTK